VELHVAAHDDRPTHIDARRINDRSPRQRQLARPLLPSYRLQRFWRLATGQPKQRRKRETLFCLPRCATARLYLAGRIDQCYFKMDEIGIVLIMNVSNSGAVRELLAKLSLGRAGLMESNSSPKLLGVLWGEP